MQTNVKRIKNEQRKKNLRRADARSRRPANKIKAEAQKEEPPEGEWSVSQTNVRRKRTSFDRLRACVFGGKMLHWEPIYIVIVIKK